MSFDMADKQKILAGRNRVDAYRTAHTKLHKKPWHKEVPEEHTPLLIAMVKTLETLGYASSSSIFGDKKTEVLKMFWDSSDLANIKELGYKDILDFEENATEEDLILLDGMWG